MKLDIILSNKKYKNLKIKNNKDTVIIKLNINNINNINNIIILYNNIDKVNINFKDISNELLINKIMTQLHNILYDYNKKIDYEFNNIDNKYIFIYNELDKYKNIVMDPNKNQKTYLKYIESRIPKNYEKKIFNLNETKLFPLTKSVGEASIHDSYFVHIYPKKYNPNNKTLFLIGKSVTFDTGGLDLKPSRHMSDMKTDMIGSAILISVLNILVNNNIDINYNIHILAPIVENVIGAKATKPGMVIKSMNNIKIEITNTDAEGRLCIVDAIEYINLYLLKDININNCLILDIATLTGNASLITNGISSIILCNNKGTKYLKQITDIGENIEEYVDTIKLRNNYVELLKSPVADIKSVNLNIKSDCIMAGAFLNYFINKDIPWLHLDVASCTFFNEKPVSYGINLLYEFIKNL